MDVDVGVDGATELAARLTHAHAGLLDLTHELGSQLLDASPAMAVATSPRMRPRTWGAGDVWTLPAGGWVVPRVQLPDPEDQLATRVQDLLDGH